MNNIRSILDKYDIKGNKLTIRNSARIIDDKIVLKKRNNDLDKVYSYLKSRSFDYFPSIIDSNDEYDIYPYIIDKYEPKEQKGMDLIYLLSLLHSKTTYFRENDIDHNKKIYEDINNEVDYLYNYYSDLISLIEKEVYMSPSSYLLARNINMVFDSIYYVKNNIEKWYKIIENNKNERVSYIHNNVNLSHYIKNEKPYLISWDKAEVDSPIYDLISFYRNHYRDLDFIDLLKVYESHYPLKEEEKLLMFSYLAMPYKLDMVNNEYKMCIKVNELINYLYKTNNLIMNYQKSK